MQQVDAAFRSDSSSEWTLYKIWPSSTLNSHFSTSNSQPSILDPQSSALSNPQPSTTNLDVKSNSVNRESSAKFVRHVRVDQNPLQAQAAADGRVSGQAGEGEGQAVLAESDAAVSAASAASDETEQMAAPRAHFECSPPSPSKDGVDDVAKGAEILIQFLASLNKVM